VQKHVHQRVIDLHVAVVLNETEFSKFVHEGVDARPRGAHHFRERRLADLRYDRLGFSRLAEIRHEQEQSGQTLLARIEKLIDQIFFNTCIPAQNISNEPLGKSRFVEEHPLDDLLFYPQDAAFGHRHRRRQAHGLARQAAFAEKIILSVDCYDGFLSALGNHADFYPAFLKVENGIRRVALIEKLLALPKLHQPSIAVGGGKKCIDVERALIPFRFSHGAFPIPVAPNILIRPCASAIIFLTQHTDGPSVQF